MEWEDGHAQKKIQCQSAQRTARWLQEGLIGYLKFWCKECSVLRGHAVVFEPLVECSSDGVTVVLRPLQCW